MTQEKMASKATVIHWVFASACQTTRFLWLYIVYCCHVALRVAVEGWSMRNMPLLHVLVTSKSPAVLHNFLPERDYVTFGSLLSQFRLSVVCLSSVTLVHPTQGLNLSAKFFHRCVRWPSFDLRAKFYGDIHRGTPPSGALNARGVSK